MSAFPFEIQHHSVTSVYIWFTPFKLQGGGGGLLWKHALIKNEEGCGKLLTHYLYRIFSSYFFSFLTYLVLIE